MASVRRARKLAARMDACSRSLRAAAGLSAPGRGRRCRDRSSTAFCRTAMALASFEVAAPKVPSAWHAAARTPASVSFFAAAATTSTLSLASSASRTSMARRRTSALAFVVSAATLETPENELIRDDGGQRGERDRRSSGRRAPSRARRRRRRSGGPSAVAAAARTPGRSPSMTAAAQARDARRREELAERVRGVRRGDGFALVCSVWMVWLVDLARRRRRRTRGDGATRPRFRASSRSRRRGAARRTAMQSRHSTFSPCSSASHTSVGRAAQRGALDGVAASR